MLRLYVCSCAVQESAEEFNNTTGEMIYETTIVTK